MGHIKEPYGIDFVVDPKPVTVEDRKMTSEVIAYYKATGRKKTKTIMNIAKNKSNDRAIKSANIHKV